MSQPRSLCVLLALCVCLHLVAAKDVGDAKVPPMGWGSWNKYACDGISGDVLMSTARQLVDLGLARLGYSILLLDDCWQIGREDDGSIRVDSERFPLGMQEYGDRLHNLGLKLGLYTCAGEFTCQLQPGSLGHEEIDAKSYAKWGVDMVKEDWCYSSGFYNKTLHPKDLYSRMSTAIASTGHKIQLNMCVWGVESPWLWGPDIATSWRTTIDIFDSWSSMIDIADMQVDLNQYAGPGSWNDPDALEIGNGGLNFEESKTHFMLWSVMAAPLFLGNDLSTITNQTLSILAAEEVIAIDQDELGVAGTKLWRSASADVELWARPLRDGSLAAVIVNRGSRASAGVDVPLAAVGLGQSATVSVRDVWQRTDVGAATGSLSVPGLPAHGSVMYKLTPVGTDLPRNWKPTPPEEFAQYAVELRAKKMGPWLQGQVAQDILAGLMIGTGKSIAFQGRSLMRCQPDIFMDTGALMHSLSVIKTDLAALDVAAAAKEIINMFQDLSDYLSQVCTACDLHDFQVALSALSKQLRTKAGRAAILAKLVAAAPVVADAATLAAQGCAQQVWGQCGLGVGELFGVVLGLPDAHVA